MVGPQLVLGPDNTHRLITRIYQQHFDVLAATTEAFSAAVGSRVRHHQQKPSQHRSALCWGPNGETRARESLSISWRSSMT
jgi:hypothetical protein